jgi:hypothetical protein
VLVITTPAVQIGPGPGVSRRCEPAQAQARARQGDLRPGSMLTLSGAPARTWRSGEAPARRRGQVERTAHAMQRIRGWQAWARPARWTAVLILALLAADVADSGLNGLFERLVAGTGAAAIAALAVGVLRRSRT